MSRRPKKEYSSPVFREAPGQAVLGTLLGYADWLTESRKGNLLTFYEFATRMQKLIDTIAWLVDHLQTKEAA